jgi:hypothetical protein
MGDEPIFKLGQHGGKRLKGQRNASGNLNWGSNSRAYIEARLQRDADLGCRAAGLLLQAIHDGRISAYAAAAEMSWIRRREVTGRGSPNVTKKNDWAMHKVLRVLNPRPNPKEEAPPGGANGA